jgi:hypothetical protein
MVSVDAGVHGFCVHGKASALVIGGQGESFKAGFYSRGTADVSGQFSAEGLELLVYPTTQAMKEATALADDRAGDNRILMNFNEGVKFRERFANIKRVM